LFVLATLVHQLAQRVSREQQYAQRSQSAARMQQQVNELVMQDMAEGVMVLDSQSRIRTINPAALQLLPDQGQSSGLLPIAGGWQGVASLVQQTFRSGESHQGMINVGQPGQPSQLIAVRCRLAVTADQEQAGLCVVFLSDQREIEARIRKRDAADTARDHDPATPAEDALVLSTEALSQDETAKTILLNLACRLKLSF
jgi:two-component system sensor histidine kinase PilS (NtrC family)